MGFVLKSQPNPNDCAVPFGGIIGGKDKNKLVWLIYYMHHFTWYYCFSLQTNVLCGIWITRRPLFMDGLGLPIGWIQTDLRFEGDFSLRLTTFPVLIWGFFGYHSPTSEDTAPLLGCFWRHRYTTKFKYNLGIIQIVRTGKNWVFWPTPWWKPNPDKKVERGIGPPASVDVQSSQKTLEQRIPQCYLPWSI